MPAIKCILCPIDFSESSVLAFDYAQSVAAHYKALVLLQHVVESLRPLYPYHAFPNDYDDICRKLRAEAVQQLVEFAKTNNCCGVRLVVASKNPPPSEGELQEAYHGSQRLEVDFCSLGVRSDCGDHLR